MNWKPIKEAPRDGTCVLLYFAECQYGRSIICEGWYFSSAKGIDDGWETPFGFIGEPTHYSEISFEGLLTHKQLEYL